MKSKLKVISLVFFFSAISLHSFSQDRVILNNDSIIIGRITSADSSMVEILKSSRPNGPEYIFRRKEIKMVVLENGKTVNYPHSFNELSLGISTSLVYYKSNNIKYQGIHHINNKLIGLSFIDRSNVISLKAELGYARLFKARTNKYVYNHGYTGYSYDTLKTDVYYGFLTIRTNFSRKNFNPYLFFSLGIEQYKEKGDVIVTVTSRVGTGLQYKFKNKYLIEGEFGINNWNEDESVSYDEMSGFYLFPYFGVNIYMIINTSYQ